MTTDEMLALKPGDLIRHKASPDAYLVNANHSRRPWDGGIAAISVIAVRIIDAHNPGEWDVVDECGRVISS